MAIQSNEFLARICVFQFADLWIHEKLIIVHVFGDFKVQKMSKPK